MVSVSSTEFFDAQAVTYKEEILPNAVRRRLTMEIGATQNWYKYVGIDAFGASVPAGEVIA